MTSRIKGNEKVRRELERALSVFRELLKCEKVVVDDWKSSLSPFFGDAGGGVSEEDALRYAPLR